MHQHALFGFQPNFQCVQNRLLKSSFYEDMVSFVEKENHSLTFTISFSSESISFVFTAENCTFPFFFPTNYCQYAARSVLSCILSYHFCSSIAYQLKYTIENSIVLEIGFVFFKFRQSLKLIAFIFIWQINAQLTTKKIMHCTR